MTLAKSLLIIKEALLSISTSSAILYEKKSFFLFKEFFLISFKDF